MEYQNSTITQMQYVKNAFDTISLWPASKVALVKSWESRDPFLQWQKAPRDTNIGLGAGYDYS